MKTRNEQSSAMILQFPGSRPARRNHLLSGHAPAAPVASLRNPRIVFGAWYHQAEIERDVKSQADS